MRLQDDRLRQYCTTALTPVTNRLEMSRHAMLTVSSTMPDSSSLYYIVVGASSHTHTLSPPQGLCPSAQPCLVDQRPGQTLPPHPPVPWGQGDVLATTRMERQPPLSNDQGRRWFSPLYIQQPWGLQHQEQLGPEFLQDDPTHTTDFQSPN